jgi:DNA-binding SARP family transcriptional activator
MSASQSCLQVRVLGPMTVHRHGHGVALPASRKVRALLAYLTLAPQPVTRGRLCELLWDTPRDPRGELRWCLTKIRRIVDDSRRCRVHTHDGRVWLDLTDCAVDAVDIARALDEDLESLSPERQRALRASFGGDFLEGIELDGSLEFSSWITAQRRRYRAHQVAVLEHLAARAPEAEASAYVETWLQVAPFDARAHEALLGMLARRGWIREGEEHLAATRRLFEAEGLDIAPIHEAWRCAKVRESRSWRVPAIASAG